MCILFINAHSLYSLCSIRIVRFIPYIMRPNRAPTAVIPPCKLLITYLHSLALLDVPRKYIDNQLPRRGVELDRRRLRFLRHVWASFWS